MAMARGSQGWRTVVATAAEEAAALARDQAIDLLVTDLQMPGMSGPELATHLRERHADLPVVLMSGWAEATALELAQPFVFLRKPFRLQGLLEAIGSMFAGHPIAIPVIPARSRCRVHPRGRDWHAVMTGVHDSIQWRLILGVGPPAPGTGPQACG